MALTQIQASMLAAGAARANFGAGAVLQVVQTQLTTVQSFSTTSYTFTNVTGAAVTITPSSASNKILVMYSCMAQTATPAPYYATYIRVTRNGTAVGVGAASGLPTGTYAFSTSGQYGMCMSQTFLDSPATTSAVTYQLQVTGESSTNVVGGSYNAYPTGASPQPNVPTTIIVMEIAA